jgi:hypothetical protein
MKRLLTAGLLLLVIGCVKGPPPVYDQPAMPVAGRWETAWVDPRIIVTDSLYTLISAQRVDSFYNEKASPYEHNPPSVTFEITEPACAVIANVDDHRGTVILPILVKNLPPGFYKLTFHANLFKPNRRMPNYFLTADVCGSEYRCPLVP